MVNNCFLGLLVIIVLLLVSSACIDSDGSSHVDPNHVPIVQDIVLMLNEGIDEDIILAYIQQHDPSYDVTSDELVAMNRAGASIDILSALMIENDESVDEEFPFELDDNYTVGAPIQYEALAVFPVYSKTFESSDSFITLDEAEHRDAVSIEEKGSGSVSSVIIINRGDLPIYICAGEVILGGKQDRMIAHDVLVSPKESIEVKVRCVEHGRWHGTTDSFSSGAVMGSTKTRVAVQFESQSDVWDIVADENSHIGAQTTTGSYRATLTHEEIQILTDEYSNVILPQLDDEGLVGMITVINGEIHSIDIFLTPDLFKNLKSKLLKATVLEVIGITAEEVTLPSPNQIQEFYLDAITADTEELQQYHSNTNQKRENSKAIVNESIINDSIQTIHINIIHK